MGEQPLLSIKAHVFQIDPATKRNWIPASKHAVTVSFFYDVGRSVYRIISVGGTKAIINSTITPNMTFTKTSQKFGQWADSRANTVYGLGFATELQLQQAPPLLDVNGSTEDKLFRSKSADMEQTTEKEQMRKMLSEGSICEMNSEAELFALRESNAKLLAALHEASGSIEQWKKQLAEYQEETDRLREQVAELEAQNVVPGPDREGEELAQSLAEMEALLKAKDEEIKILQGKKPDITELEKEREEASKRVQDLEEKNAELKNRVQLAEMALASSLDARNRVEGEVHRVVETLDVKIYDLSDLRQNLAKLLEK
nr:homer protein homolog 3b isoform X2 [Misgurnus anguillicaudatus]